MVLYCMYLLIRNITILILYVSGADGVRVTCEGEFHNGNGPRACATHVPTQLDSATRSLQRWSSGEDFFKTYFQVLFFLHPLM